MYNFFMIFYDFWFFMNTLVDEYPRKIVKQIYFYFAMFTIFSIFKLTQVMKGP